MRFKNPEFFLLLFVCIPIIWIYIRREMRNKVTVRFSDLSIIKKLRPSPRIILRHVLPILRIAALALFIVALARPQRGNTEEEITTEGVDIMLVLDVSTSMRALDFKPNNRFHVARETIKQFVARRNHDLIGLVVFAGRSYTKCPLTLDYGVLTRFLDEIQFGEIPDGTAIGTAIATSANRMQNSRAKSKVIILLTDGANNAGDIAPLTAARAAAELGIKIYTVGVGKKGQVPYPFEGVNPFTGQKFTQVQMIESDIDEQSLVNIADVTGAQYFRAHDAAELEQIYARIDELEKTEIQTKSFTTWSDSFYQWLLWGAAVLALELLLAQTWLRRAP